MLNIDSYLVFTTIIFEWTPRSFQKVPTCLLYSCFNFQYTFPPSCVGEVRRVGAPSRREVGHGMLAERALEPILPSHDDFPYTIRVESTITESNGSSRWRLCLLNTGKWIPLILCSWKQVNLPTVNHSANNTFFFCHLSCE